MSETQRDPYVAELRAEYERVRAQHASKKGPEMVTLAQARANRTPVDWAAYTPPKPRFIGRKIFRNFDLAELAQYIDWGPFFQVWDLAGPHPEILEDAVVGEAARHVHNDGLAMLKKAIDGRWLTAHGVITLLPANTVNDDDIEIYLDESRSEVALTWYGMRQQTKKPSNTPNRCLSDFIAPKGQGEDYIGMFAVTAGLGIDKKLKEFEAAHDDYKSIMLKAIADRLAEAFAEAMHARVRREFWGYASEEHLENHDLIAEKYLGIRPAPGYPACPDHTVKGPFFEALNAGEVDITITESFAMMPAASVSGFYFSHPDSTYFNVGKIGTDQLEDMAKRRGVPKEELERWLAPNL
jgi:5-methyltetrahydrofolate--homocysteine methyltransferase